jgi:hypothetical protein
MRFTDNPLERLMQEKPNFYRDRPPRKCRGCGRWNGEKCEKCTRKNKGGGTSGQAVPKFA